MSQRSGIGGISVLGLLVAAVAGSVLITLITGEFAHWPWIIGAIVVSLGAFKTL